MTKGIRDKNKETWAQGLIWYLVIHTLYLAREIMTLTLMAPIFNKDSTAVHTSQNWTKFKAFAGSK